MSPIESRKVLTKKTYICGFWEITYGSNNNSDRLSNSSMNFRPLGCLWKWMTRKSRFVNTLLTDNISFASRLKVFVLTLYILKSLQNFPYNAFGNSLLSGTDFWFQHSCGTVSFKISCSWCKSTSFSQSLI